jgi:SulP family sulfate permease
VGLYASLLPSIVAALFGSSPQLNTGPVALTSLLTAAALAPLALPGSDTWLVLAVQLALLAGLLQLAFGALRLAHFADLLSHPVLHGFINACSVLICLAQLPALLGLNGAGQLPFAEAWPTWPAACPAPTCRPSPSARRPSCC